MEMDRIVTYRLQGEVRQSTVKNAATEDEAKAAVTNDIAQSLHFVSITAVPPKRKKSLYETYADGFRNLFSFPDSDARGAEADLSNYLDEVFPTKAPAQ